MESISDSSIRIRTMEDISADYSMLLKWLSNSTVQEWYENREELTLEAIELKYKPRITGKSHVHSMIIEYEGTPVGYLQFYETRKEKEYAIKEAILEEPNVWAMDILIGETEHLGKGIGSRSLKLILQYLFQEKGARKVIIDPDVRNERAIRAYEKAGFKKVKILKNWEQHEGLWTDSWLMVCERGAVSSE